MRNNFLKTSILFLISQFAFSQNQIEILPFIKTIQNLDFTISISPANKKKEPIKTKLILLSKIIEDDRQTKL